MKFLRKCTATEYQEQVRRATEAENGWYQGREEGLAEIKAQRTAEAREDAGIRQQKHRQKTYDKEIVLGERTPGGTKRIQKVRKFSLVN
jgi:hypothetical protein